MYQASAGIVGLIPNKSKDGFSFDTNAIGSGREATEVRRAALDTLAAKMASVILGESGKTISDRDRQLVRDMLGDIRNLGGAFVSEAAIKTRLEQLEKQVLSEMSTADAEINAFEDTYSEAVIKGTRGIEQIGGKVFPSEGGSQEALDILNSNADPYFSGYPTMRFNEGGSTNKYENMSTHEKLMRMASEMYG